MQQVQDKLSPKYTYNLANESLKQFIIRRWVGFCKTCTRTYIILYILDIFAEAIKGLANKPIIKTVI